MPTLQALSRYRFTGKSERAVREEWIRPLLEHLGYGIDTLNDLRYEDGLKLAQPLRRLGSKTVNVDYIPTVLGHGLWVIEAKAPETRDSWEEAIGQAWTYATHPEVDVPLMAIADGTRFEVYDVTKPDWDSPVARVSIENLERDFGSLHAEIGAPHVTAKIRERQLRHIGTSMRAELDPRRLDETVESVRRLAIEARPAVIANRASVLRDQLQRDQGTYEEHVLMAGIWGLAQYNNVPLADSLGSVRLAADHIRSLPEVLRARELGQFTEATRKRSIPDDGTTEPGPARMAWMLRVIALGTYLELLDDPACGELARKLANQAVRDHILNFPDDALARAAHRFEQVLPPYLLRTTLANPEIDLPAVARDQAQRLGDEALLRNRPHADQMLLQTVTIMCRMSMAAVEWTVDGLNDAARELETALPTIEYPTDRGQGQAGDPHMSFYLEADQLVIATLDLLARNGKLKELEPDVQDLVRTTLSSESDHVKRWAERLFSSEAEDES